MSHIQTFLAQTADKADILARAIIGPTNTGNFPVDREKLAQLRAIRWEQATAQEQGEALTAARSVLVEMLEQGWLAKLPV